MKAVPQTVPGRPRILIIGGGYVGMYTAIRLLQKLRDAEATVTVVDPRSYMTYQPFLPEAAAGSIQPRHVVVPLRRVLRGAEVVTGMVTGLDHERHVATVLPLEGHPYELTYDQVIVAVGSVSRTLPIPGLADRGIGFKTIGEAIYLRNHVISRLDLAASIDDPERRKRALTFVFVGGGYAGVEAMAELEDMARYVLRYVPGVEADEMRWVLIETASRIMPEVSVRLSDYTVKRLTERNIDAVTGLSGPMPAYLYLVVEALIEAGVHQGLSREVAQKLVIGTFEGSAALLVSTGESPEELRHQVTSPGGTTAAGLRTLESRAVRSAFIDAVAAAAERSRQMGR